MIPTEADTRAILLKQKVAAARSQFLRTRQEAHWNNYEIAMKSLQDHCDTHYLNLFLEEVLQSWNS